MAGPVRVRWSRRSGRSGRGLWVRRDWPGRAAPGLADAEAVLVPPPDTEKGDQGRADHGFARIDGRPLGAQLLHPLLRLRSEEHTSELQSLMRISYAVFCLK